MWIIDIGYGLSIWSSWISIWDILSLWFNLHRLARLMTTVGSSTMAPRPLPAVSDCSFSSSSITVL